MRISDQTFIHRLKTYPKGVDIGESSYAAIEMIDLDLHLLNLSMYECLLTNESVCRCFEVTSQNNTS